MFGQRLPLGHDRHAVTAGIVAVLGVDELRLVVGHLTLAFDVDAPAGELACQAGILALFCRWPARAWWSSGTMIVAERPSSSTNTSRTRAGDSALATKRAGSSL